MSAWSDSRSRTPAAVEAWLCRHADLVALALVVVAVIVRLRAASGTFLNADEALHFLIANQPDLEVAYRYSLTNAHPPLYYLVLHFWLRLGDGELALRLLSVITGAATVWVVWRWLGRVAQAWGLATALLLATLPSLVALGAEVRGYALLLLLMAGSLLTLEKAMAEGSARAMVGSALLLYGAILTHYSAPLFAAALGVAGFLRVVVTRPGRRFTLVWIGTQAGAAALLIFLLFSHVSRIHGSGMDREAHTTWLRAYFFDRADGDLVHFVVGRTGGALAYAFGSKAGAVIGLLLFSIGVILLLTGRLRNGNAQRAGRYLGVAVVVAFALTCGAAVAGLFPYGNTRHVAFLALFAVPAVCFPVVWATRGSVWASLLIAAAAAVGIHGVARPSGWELSRESRQRHLMVSAIDTLRHRLPVGEPVLVDYQTSLLLAYYLRDGGVGPFPVVRGELGVVPVGSVRLLVWASWDFTPASLKTALERVAEVGPARPGQSLWVVDAGWGQKLAEGGESFGDGIALFAVEVPVEPSSVTGPRDPVVAGARQ